MLCASTGGYARLRASLGFFLTAFAPFFSHPSPLPSIQTRAKGESRPREAWEGSFYFLLAGTALVVALGAYKPNVNVRDWARDEASERVRRGAAGLEVQPGVNYSGLRLLKEAGALSEDEAAALEAGAIPAPARSLA